MRKDILTPNDLYSIEYGHTHEALTRRGIRKVSVYWKHQIKTYSIMCLKIKERKQQTATHPITVYKIVIQIDNDYYTPYTYTPILPETLQGLVPFEAKGKAHVIKDGLAFMVSKGTIHTHANASEAFGIADFYNRRKSREYNIVYECEIPKGTKYYKGKGESNFNEYASKQIRFVKRLHSPYEPKPIQTELELR